MNSNKILKFIKNPYLVAVLLILFSASLRIWPMQTLGLRAPWLTFYPTVMLIALYGGVYAGMFGTILSCLIVLFLGKYIVGQEFLQSSADYLGMVVFFSTCAMISIVTEAMHRARKKMKKTEVVIKEMNSKLFSANADLEKRVSERTSELMKINDILRDEITSRNKIEATLRTSETLYRNTLDNMLEGCQVLGFDWRYIYINGTAEGHNKRPNEELIGNVYMDMWPGIGQTEVFAEEQICMKDRVIRKMINEFVFPDGSVGWFKLTFQPVPQGICIFSEDITEIIKSEKALKQLNEDLEKMINERTKQLESSNKDLEAFTYSVSHDLRAPLRAINGYAKILEEDYAANFDSEGNRFLNSIQKNAHSMSSLIDDLLAFSRLGKKDIKKTKFDMNELINNILPDITGGYNSNIHININELNVVNADINLMKQVIINLISNSIKYSQKGENPVIDIQSKFDDGQIVFSIKDNGVGFDMKHYNKLFEVFQRLHSANEYDGTGVGLAIVKRIIDKHGGKVWAESKINEGATFYFSLPN